MQMRIIREKPWFVVGMSFYRDPFAQASGWSQDNELKAYFPVCDRVQAIKVPDWIAHWPEWLPEEGMGLAEGEEG